MRLIIEFSNYEFPFHPISVLKIFFYVTNSKSLYERNSFYILFRENPFSKGSFSVHLEQITLIRKESEEENLFRVHLRFRRIIKAKRFAFRYFSSIIFVPSWPGDPALGTIACGGVPRFRASAPAAIS